MSLTAVDFFSCKNSHMYRFSRKQVKNDVSYGRSMPFLGVVVVEDGEMRCFVPGGGGESWG